MGDLQAAELEDGSSRPEEDAVFEPASVLRMLWADPQNMPEHLALWSLKEFGPRASSAVEKLRSSHPAAEPGELEQLVIERQTRVSMTEGAFVGGPFIVLLPVAFCAALLAQAQMAFELATLAGCAPNDGMRAADLLVLQGAYASTSDASAALAKMARDPKSREGKRLPRGTRVEHDQAHGVLARCHRVGRREAEPAALRARDSWGRDRVPGRTRAPARLGPVHGDGVPKERASDGRTGDAVLRREDRAEAGVTIRKAQTVRIGMSAGLARMLALISLPVRGRLDRVADRHRHRRREVAQRLHPADRYLRAGHARLVRVPQVAPAPPAAGETGRGVAALTSTYRQPSTPPRSLRDRATAAGKDAGANARKASDALVEAVGGLADQAIDLVLRSDKPVTSAAEGKRLLAGEADIEALADKIQRVVLLSRPVVRTLARGSRFARVPWVMLASSTLSIAVAVRTRRARAPGARLARRPPARARRRARLPTRHSSGSSRSTSTSTRSELRTWPTTGCASSGSHASGC